MHQNRYYLDCWLPTIAAAFGTFVTALRSELVRERILEENIEFFNFFTCYSLVCTMTFILSGHPAVAILERKTNSSLE